MITGKLQASLIELIAFLKTHTEIDTLILKLELKKYATGGTNKESRLTIILNNIVESEDSREIKKVFLRILREIVEPLVDKIEEDGSMDDYPWVKKINDILAEFPRNGFKMHQGVILLATPESIDLTPQISSLQSDLFEAGLTVALLHYNQAHENFNNLNFESSNSQLRSFLENLYIKLCELKSKKLLTDASAALQTLKSMGLLNAGEYNLARGMFETSNERGAHHGLTDDEEALFRFHFTTALGRYILKRLIGKK